MKDWRRDHYGTWLTLKCEACNAEPQAHELNGRCLFGPTTFTTIGHTSHLRRTQVWCYRCTNWIETGKGGTMDRCPHCNAKWILRPLEGSYPPA